MYDNLDKAYLQYNFGFVLFQITKKQLRMQQFNNKRVRGRKNNSAYQLAEGSFDLGPGRYAIVPFGMQKGESIFLYLDIFTSCYPALL